MPTFPILQAWREARASLSPAALFGALCLIRQGHSRGLGGSFENCNFIKIRAKKSHVTGLFVSCTFESTDFSGAMFVGNFEDCTFSNCSLNVDAFTAGFKDCTFVDCTLPSWLGEDASTLPAQRKTTVSVKSGKVYFNEYTKFHNEPSIV
jgi:hypothetical protein